LTTSRIDTSTKRVVSYEIVWARPAGKSLQLRQPVAHRLADVERVRAGLQEDADQRRRAVVDMADEVVLQRAEFDAGDVTEPHHREVLVRTHDDRLELPGVGQAAARGQRVDEFLAVLDRLLADLARRELRVLAGDRAPHVAGGDAELCHAIGLQPDAHRVVLGAEDLHVGGARDALQLVEHVQRHVVARVEVVERAVGRRERDHLQERRRELLDQDALAAHFVGQPRFGLLDAVVDVECGAVDVGADLERDLQFEEAVAARGRVHVEQALDAADLVLQRGGDGLFEYLRRGAGVVGAHDDLRWCDLGVLRDRQRAHRRESGEHDHQRQHGGRDRPIDEDA
jgi:hypothetical protein